MRRWIMFVNVWCVLVPTICLAGPKWEFGDDMWMTFSFLGQAHFSVLDNAADDKDVYLRRGRFILTGQIMEGVKLFTETDTANLGKNGVDAETKIQDAFVDVRLGQMNLWVKGGLILLPFSFETGSSAASLLGIDYNAEVIKLTNTFVWRDHGAEIHGSAGDIMAFQVGVFDGYKGNADADLRVTGHIAFSLTGNVNSGWFHSQNPLSRENYLSIGAGFDTQDKATIDQTGMALNSRAWVVDFQSGFGWGDAAWLTLNGGYYDWDSSVFVGDTLFLEGGMLLRDQFQVTVKYSSQDPDFSDTTEDYTFGLHYFHKKHHLRGGIEYRTGDSSDWWLAGIQVLL